MGKVIALHAADLSLIHAISYAPPSTLGVIPEAQPRVITPDQSQVWSKAQKYKITDLKYSYYLLKLLRRKQFDSITGFSYAEQDLFKCLC